MFLDLIKQLAPPPTVIKHLNFIFSATYTLLDPDLYLSNPARQIRALKDWLKFTQVKKC
jgi:hypothetical protein